MEKSSACDFQQKVWENDVSKPNDIHVVWKRVLGKLGSLNIMLKNYYYSSNVVWT